MLCTRSYAQLKATFAAYATLSEREMEEAIKSEVSGSVESGYLAIGKCHASLRTDIRPVRRTSKGGGLTWEKKVVRWGWGSYFGKIDLFTIPYGAFGPAGSSVPQQRPPRPPSG